jgi:hypothetical protein
MGNCYAFLALNNDVQFASVFMVWHFVELDSLGATTETQTT